MRTVGLFEAKQKLSQLVDEASKGQQIGISKRGKLAAMLISPPARRGLDEIFADIEEINKSARPRKGLSVKDMIEEGRR